MPETATILSDFPGWRGLQPWEPRAPGTVGHDALFAGLEAMLAAHPPRHGYRPDARFIEHVASLAPEQRALVGRDFLLWQMARFDQRWAQQPFAPEFHGWFVDAFHAILDQIESAHFVGDVTRDVWQKNLALTRLQLVPAAAQLVTMASGVPRSLALKAGPGGLYHVAIRCGGFDNFCEIHTHDPLVPAYFNPRGWQHTCHLLALLMRDHPQCRGAFATSWFFDPALAAISPKLAYLHDRPAAARARFLRMGPDAESIDLATGFPPRRKAYEAGRYQPTRYAIVWPRKEILRHYG